MSLATFLHDSVVISSQFCLCVTRVGYSGEELSGCLTCVLAEHVAEWLPHLCSG